MDKPFSLFLNNVVENGAITFDEAAALNRLATPHLQFEAVMALKRARQITSCGETISLPQPKTSFMANTRWIEVAVLGLTIPLVHAFFVRSPEIKKSVGVFAAAPSIVFVAQSSQAQLPKKHPFHPKDEREALDHFMNEPLQPAKPIPYEPTLGQAPSRLSDQTDADNAALEAMPITSRR